ncbi:MAG: hypothetical protein ABIL27_01335 [candidate division WOR-3 bacterium]
MIDHLEFFKKNLVPNLIIMAGEEQYPADMIVKEYKRRIEADSTTVIWADEYENLIGKVVEKLGAGIMRRNVVWVKGLERVKGYKKVLRDLVKSVRGFKGCAISVSDSVEEFKDLEGQGVLLINMRPLTEDEFKKWLKKHLPWIASRPELMGILEDSFKGMHLSEIYLEIKKLKLFSETPARESLNLLWHQPTTKVYELANYILSKDIEGAFRVLDNLKEQGENPINIVSFLMREVERLVYIKLGKNLPKYQYARLKKYQNWISNGEISLALEKLKRADFDLKGKIRGESQWSYLKVLVKDLVKLLGKIPYEDSRP